MAACNAILEMEGREERDRIERDLKPVGKGDEEEEEHNYFSDSSEDETSPLVRVNLAEQAEKISSVGRVFSLSRQMEIAAMADLLYNNAGKVAMSVCMVVYLYGDLAIYCTAVAKSLRDVSCTFVEESNSTSSCNIANVSLSQRCWSSSTIDRSSAYRIFVGVFLLLLGPFSFFNLSKTMLRWAAFTAMVVLAVIKISDPSSPHGTPPVAEWTATPALFGTSVYAFMCHHSLPGMVTPISNKSKLTTIMAVVYTFIAIFYFILAFTGIFAFPQVQNLYTLMFSPCSTTLSPTLITDYFLSLFPVFTLSTNFPIIAITLRKNLEELITSIPAFSTMRPITRRTVFPLLAIVPPALIAVATEDLGILVTITGAYAGAGIQYVIPCTLVWCARRRISSLQAEPGVNPLASPFKNITWLLLVLGWTCVAIVLVTINFIAKAF